MKVATAWLALVALWGAADARRPRLDPRVHRKLQSTGTANIFVTMQEGLGAVLANEPYFATRGAKIKDLVMRMEEVTNRSQEALAEVVQAAQVDGLASEVRHFWITNEIYFGNATWDLVEKLIQLENAGIADIREEIVVHQEAVMAVNSSSDFGAMQAPSWGVQRIQAPSVWASGNFGQGVVVGVMDSGVRATHEALRNNFRSNYGWYDPQKKTATPYDAGAHGTHVTAIAVGSKGVGVAPGAQWIACKACRVEVNNECTEADIKECAQFMLCPTDTNGLNQDCSKAPKIINLSLGNPAFTDTLYSDLIPPWTAAGIIPVASIGNMGPGCSVTSAPGRLLNVIGVGATASNDTLAWFSSRGPFGTRLKPDVSAPGVDIRSAVSTSDNAYQSLQGSSMATPHVTGTVALMLSANPSLNVTQILDRFATTSDTFMMKQPWLVKEAVCEAVADLVWGKWPNIHYGRGLVNALGAVRGPCYGLDSTTCESTFFCTWNSLASRCQRWW